MNEKTIHKLVAEYLPYSLHGFDNYYTIFRDEDSGVEGYTVQVDNIFLVIFKSSNEEKDWKTNFKFLNPFSKKSYPYGDPKETKVRIHDSYVRGYLKVKKEIQEAFVKSGCDEVCVIGYSMGAGLAPIAALDLQYNNNVDVGCGFADGPRVFNKAGMESFNKRVPLAIRYKYGNDIVTKIPFQWMNFFHVGKYHHIGPKEHWYIFSFKDHAQYKKIVKYAKGVS